MAKLLIDVRSLYIEPNVTPTEVYDFYKENGDLLYTTTPCDNPNLPANKPEIIEGDISEVKLVDANTEEGRKMLENLKNTKK